MSFIPFGESNGRAELPATASAWKEALDKGLGQLSAVTALRVEVTKLIAHVSYDAVIDAGAQRAKDFETEKYDVDFDYRPDETSFVQFVVTIPMRMHAELTARPDDFGTERFELTTRYGVWGPVTFIRPLDSQYKGRPSTTVVLVREFMIRELARAEAPIEVINTGPSPFHGDFKLQPREGVKGITHNWQKLRYAYDDIDFYYDPAQLNSDTAYQSLIHLLVDPFSTYYTLVRSRQRRMKVANAIQKMSSDLVAIHTDSGARAWFNKTLRSGGLARDLTLAAIAANQSDVETREALREHVLTFESVISLPNLVEICEKEVDAHFNDRLATAQEVARTLEGGRISQYEVFVLSVSTILGAAAGAIAALIAG